MGEDQDIDGPGSLTKPVERRLIRAHLIGAAMVQEWDKDIGEHVAGEQVAMVREQDRGVADGVRLMLDDFAWHGSPPVGSGVRSPISSTGMLDALCAGVF